MSFIKFLSLSLLISWCGLAKAQFYDSETIHYYIKSGSRLSDHSDVVICVFDGHTARYRKVEKSIITKRLKESSDYWLNEFANNNNGLSLEYDTEYSTSVRTTYAYDCYGQQRLVQTGPFSTEWVQPVIGRMYKAFSDDKSEFISFYIKKNSDNVTEKEYWQEISVSELMPKGVNKDFLY